jgi:transmembrane sensor
MSDRFTEASEWFVKLREEPESSERIGEWLEWLDSDPRNQEAFTEARRIWQLTAGATDVTLRRNASRSRKAQWLIAASILLCVALGTTAWLRIAQRGSEFVTGRGESRRFELADGSHVELAGDSKLRASLSPTHRDIDLVQGEAYFQVAHDKARPFIVHAGTLHVTAIGTAFNVRTAEDRVVVAVEEGVVMVEPRDPESRISVRRGEEIAVTAGTPKPQLMRIEPNTVASWRSGRLYFAREPLRSVLASVRAASGVQIRLADPSLGDLRFTGTVFNDKISDWVEGLPAVFPVQISQDGTGFVVKEKK